MKEKLKFTKLITYLNDREHELARELVDAASKNRKETVIINAVHEEMKKTMAKAMEFLKEDTPALNKWESSPQLKLVSSRKDRSESTTEKAKQKKSPIRLVSVK